MSSTDPRHEARQEAAVQRHGRALGLSLNDRFNGDFEGLPIVSHIECGPVPIYPTSDDFQNAAMSADRSPAHRWRFEAIRFRRNEGYGLTTLGPAELKTIALAVAAALYRLTTAES